MFTHDPNKPPFYIIEYTNGMGNVIIYPKEIIEYCAKAIVYYLAQAQFNHQEEFPYARIEIQTEWAKRNLAADFKDNPYSKFFAKTRQNYLLGVSYAQALWNYNQVQTDLTDEFMRLYQTVCLVNILWWRDAKGNPINPKPLITELPFNYGEAKTVGGSCRKLMRDYPFTKKPEWFTQRPNWWLYDEWDDVDIQDRELYRYLSGR